LPADILLEHEDERREWLEALAKRPLAQRIVMVMMDENVSKPAELAKILGEPPARIYKALDWLRSKISEVRKKKVA
jgi:DNA-directed RNA polymerase specialized sigma24 family protein